MAAYETSDFDPSRQIRVLVLEPGEGDAALIANFQFATIDPSNVPQPAEHQNIEWDAISYSWEGQEPSVSMSIGEEKVRSTQIVQQLLHDLRSLSERRFLWIDALCINQEDNGEKSLQIPMMRSIFEQARSVIIWVRPESPESRDAARTVAEAAVWADGLDINSLSDQETLFRSFRKEELTWRNNAFRRVLEASWFCRIWVIQEAVVNRNLLVWLAGQRVSWELFGSATLRFMSRLPAKRAMEADLSECFKPGYLHTSMRPPVTFAHSMVKLITNLRHWFHNSTMPMPASHLVALCQNSRATLPVDMIYGVCGLFGVKDSTTRERKAFPVDYQISPKELYKSFTIWCIEREGNLDILASNDNIGPRTREGLPTWAADWSLAWKKPEDFNRNPAREHNPFTGNVPKALTPTHAPIYRLAGDTLVLRGFVVDTLRDLEALQPPPSPPNPNPFCHWMESQVHITSPPQQCFPSPFWRDGASAQCQWAGGRARYTTKSGRTAYAEGRTDPLSKICALYGGRGLFLLDSLPGDRPKGTPLLYKLRTCGCFIDGFEDGKGIEFARENGIKEEDFHII